MLLAVLLVGLAVFGDAAPKSKRPQLVYDQKQTGEHNIQVHLKDFQIIALLGEDTLGGFGDYDYSYDYADFTVKPSGSSSSTKPSEDISTTTKFPEVYITSTKPSESSSTTLKPIKDEVVINTSSSEEPIIPEENTSGKPLALLGETKPEEQKPSSAGPIDKKDDLPSSTEKLADADKKESLPAAADAVPGQIHVHVVNSPEGYPNLDVRKDSSENKDSTGKSNDKKCLTGFSRDKRGRCRRVRKPQNALPFNFGRLAQYVSKFRSIDGLQQ